MFKNNYVKSLPAHNVANSVYLPVKYLKPTKTHKKCTHTHTPHTLPSLTGENNPALAVRLQEPSHVAVGALTARPLPARLLLHSSRTLWDLACVPSPSMFTCPFHMNTQQLKALRSIM